MAFSPQTSFTIPDYNGSINFAVRGAYANATLENGVWDFTGFSLSSTKTMLPQAEGFYLSIGAQNSKVTVTQFNPINVFPPEGTGTLEYNVNGLGNQTVNIQFGRGNLDNRWIAYTVSIDGNNRTQGDGWALSSDGWITIMAATNNVKIAYGLASPKSFPSGSQFAIPALNGSVSFIDGGIYIFTDFNGSMWMFQDLILGSNASSPNEVTWGLGFSAENCAVQVSSWAPNLDSGGWVNYTVQGVGAQTLNGNYDTERRLAHQLYRVR